MKTSRCRLQKLLLIAGGLMIYLPAGNAAPGGSGATTGTAAAAATGGHASAPAATAHSSGAAVSVGHSAGGMGSGLRSSVGGTSGFRPGFGNGTGITRVPGGGYSATGLGAGQHLGTVQAGTTRASLPLPTVTNAWTDPQRSRVAGASTNATPYQQSGLAGYVRPGNHLNPGAYGYAANRPANGQSQHGQNGGERWRGHRRYYYNNFPYGVFYPYLYNNYGYGGYGNSGYYAGAADYGGLIADSTNSDLGAPDFSISPNNYYSYVAPDQGNPNATDPSSPAQPLPDAPAVGPQAPSSAEKPATDNTASGPDSLVEAVQNELTRRGYFGGPADSMYSAATKEAIRRFQTDQHLPATGRINEATLHALRLD